jgi:succinate dehydrogenase / fumarate reductase, cytochrome b subunit
MSVVATLETRSSNPLGLTQFLLRRFHSLAGVEFGAYLVVHLIVNATIAQGGRVFQDQVDKLESIPLLVVVEWTFIYLPILFHAVYGAWMVCTANYNTRLYPYWGNWRFLLQRVSGIVLIGFLGFHVLALRFNLFGHRLGFDTHDATYAIWQHTNAHWLIAYGV